MMDEYCGVDFSEESNIGGNIMEEYSQVANYALKIAEYLEKDQISITNLPLDEIILIIQQMSDVIGQKGDVFAELYSCFLSRDRDKTDIVSALKLFAEYTLIFEQKDAMLQNFIDECGGQINIKTGKIWELHTRLGYYINCDKIRDWYARNEYKAYAPFNGKGVIYSAITGDYDDVKEPEYISDEFDYILFTNNPRLTSDVWKVVLVDNEEQLDNARLARKIKIMGHEYLPEYDYSIWVDGKIKIKGNIRQYIDTYKRNEPMLCFNHFERDCIYEEKKFCISTNKDVPEIIENQIERYRMEGYPERNGMVDTGIIVREIHDERVKKVMETWWLEILHGSVRDQLSFNYACWKNDFVYDTSDFYIYENPYVEMYEHKGFK